MIEHYRPLPKCVTLALSELDGYGIFATEALPEGRKLGPSHFEEGPHFLRLPFGGFLNHSEEPNCERRREGSFWYVFPLKDLDIGEELTLRYRDYDPTQ